MIRSFFLLLAFIPSIIGFGQDSISRNSQDSISHNSIEFANNSLYIELLGTSLLYGSVNYERIFIHKGRFYFSGRFGVGAGSFYTLEIYSIPIMFNGIFRISHGFSIETGYGLSPMRQSREYLRQAGTYYYDFIALIGMFGIRIQNNKGFLFRLSYTPFLDLGTDRKDPNINHPGGFYSWAGLSFGWTFGKKKK